MIFPDIPGDQRHDFHITDDAIGVGTPGERYANNVRAICLLKRLEAEERLATPEEQETLAQYVGWGGLAVCFEEKHSKPPQGSDREGSEQQIIALRNSRTSVRLFFRLAYSCRLYV